MCNPNCICFTWAELFDLLVIAFPLAVAVVLYALLCLARKVGWL